MLPMSGRSWRGFAQPSRSWLSDSSWRSSTCSSRLQLPRWSTAHSHCRVRGSATFITAKNIDSEELHPGPGARIDVALALLLVALGCALFLYLSHALVAAQ